MTISAVLAWASAALVAVLGAALLGLTALAHDAGAPWAEQALGSVACLTAAGMGVVVARSRPAPVIGWLMLATALALAASGFADAYARYAGSPSVSATRSRARRSRSCPTAVTGRSSTTPDAVGRAVEPFLRTAFGAHEEQGRLAAV